MSAILHKFVDADQWEAEDLVGRLGIITHAAFLSAGFHTYGARPPSGHLLRQAAEATGSLCLSRCYTAPQLAHRDGADAAVLVVSAQGSEIALLMLLTAGGGDWRRNVYLERLHLAAVAPLLSLPLGDAEPWASRVCRALAGGACLDLLAELYRGNGLVMTAFVPLPDDMVVEILKRLGDAEGLARVESTCRDMRRLVAERDGELWKPLYEATSVRRRRWRGRWLPSWFFLALESSDSESEEVELGSSTWKEKFVEARPRPWASRILFRRMFDFETLLVRIRWPELPSSSPLDWLRDSPEKDTVSRKGESTGGRRRNGPWTRDNHKKKWRGAGAGAIHSPSSRYRWKHR